MLILLYPNLVILIIFMVLLILIKGCHKQVLLWYGNLRFVTGVLTGHILWDSIGIKDMNMSMLKERKTTGYFRYWAPGRVVERMVNIIFIPLL